MTTIPTTAESSHFTKHVPSLNEFWQCRFIKEKKFKIRSYMLEVSDQGADISQNHSNTEWWILEEAFRDYLLQLPY